MLDMEAVNAASRELLIMSTGGSTAQQLVEKAYQYVTKPITVLDELYRVIAFFAPGVSKSDCRRESDDDIGQRREWRKIVQASNEPVIDENAGGKYRAMCMDVRYNGIDVGKLAMMETSPFVPEDAEILKALSCALAVQMIGSSALILSNLDRERAALLKALINGEPLERDLYDMLAFMSIPVDQEMRLFIYQSAGEQAMDSLNIQRRLNRLIKVICTEIEGSLICLTGDTECRNAVNMLEQIARDCNLRCGVSRPFRDFHLVRDYCRQALSALLIAAKHDARLLYYEEHVAEDIVQLCLADRSGITYCRREITALRDYDRLNGTDLLQTLTVYLRNMCSMAETARECHLHYNTIKYRLKQIEEICGIQEITAEDLFEYMLSIRVLEQTEE